MHKTEPSTSLRRAPLCLVATALIASSNGYSPAMAVQPTNIEGSREGSYFEYQCGAGKVLVGLRGSAGVLIDNIQAICAKVDGSGGYAEASPVGPVFGNNRPFDRFVQCPPTYAVKSVDMGMNEANPHIGAIRLNCYELAHPVEGGMAVLELRGSGNLEGHQDDISIAIGNNPGGSIGRNVGCGTGFATGIRGRAGSYLSALGLNCGPATAVADPTANRTLGKRKKSSIEGKYPDAASTTSAVPQTQRTLGKRKRPDSWGAPAPEPTGGAGSVSVNSDGSTGAYTKGNGWTGSPPPSSGTPPPAPAPAVTEGPSEAIGGDYATVVEVSESRCLFKDMRGSAQRTILLDPNPAIRIPLNEFSNFFGGPVMVNVQGLNLSQSTTIQMVFGPASSQVPATFQGAFTPDGTQFNMNFEAGNDLCRIRGMIRGSRQG